MLELAEAVWHKIRGDEPFRWVSDEPYEHDVQLRVPATEKAAAVLGFEATTTLAFLALAVMSGPDVAGIVKGTIGFSIPPDEGVHGALLVAVSVIGAVAGSIANFVHPYVMRQKGWVGPEHKRIQRNDLLFAVIVGIVINRKIDPGQTVAASLNAPVLFVTLKRRTTATDSAGTTRM